MELHGKKSDFTFPDDYTIKFGETRLIEKDPIYKFCPVCKDVTETKLEFVTISYNCRCGNG